MDHVRRWKGGILLFALFLLSALFFTLPAENVGAEGGVASVTTQAGETTEYAELSGAISAWMAGSTLKLLADGTLDAALSVSEEKTLDLNGFTLSRTGGRTIAVETTGTLTVTDTSSRAEGAISGGGVRVRGTFALVAGNLRSNSAEDGGGVYVDVGGVFSMRGGSVTDNTATGYGGGVYLNAGGSLLLSGGRIAGNSAAYSGGGVYAAGTVTLSGGARIEGNSADGETDNLYLPAGVAISVGEFTGSAGVRMAQEGTFARSGSAACFTADDPAYRVSESDGVLSLTLSQLVSVAAEYEPSGIVYPRTSAETIRACLVLSGVNENGAAYPEGRFTYEIALPDGGLAVGENEIVLTATGEGGERVQTSFTVDVQAPVLNGITVVFEQSSLFYFDSKISALAADLTVTGSYTDGYSRTLLQSAEETAGNCGESYITDYYTLPEGVLDDVLAETGRASVSVTAGEYTARFDVTVSKYVLDVTDISVRSLTVVEGESIVARDFTPDLPIGITPVVTISEGVSLSSPVAGRYTATITFIVADTENYESIDGALQAELTVLYSQIAAEDGSYSLSSPDGISLDWELSVKDVTDDAEKPDLDSSLECGQIWDFLLREDGDIVNGATEGAFTVRLLLAEDLRDKEVRLYRVLSDGSVAEIAATRDGDYLVFESSYLTARYVAATDSNFGVYLWLTVLFGVLCVAGAGLLLWYFRRKKKI